MAVGITLLGVDNSGPLIKVIGEFTLSNTPAGYVTNGDTINWQTIAGIAAPGGGALNSQSLPSIVQGLMSQTGQITYQYTYAQGTTQANCLLLVTTASNTQFAQGNYNSTLLADKVSFVAYFPKY